MNRRQAPSIQARRPRLTLRSTAKTVTGVLFAVFVVLALATPSWRVGPFAWLPLLRFPMLAGRPASFGLASSLPALIVAGWLVVRLTDRSPRSWNWGARGITLPIAGLTLIILSGLDPAPTWRTVVQVVGLGLAWLTYLFVLNEQPSLRFPLALIVLVQGGVALGQFLCQRDLNLTSLGEPTLNPEVSGISVVWAEGQRWLRAYGLTGHPNLLGATLAILLLLLRRDIQQSRGWRRAWYTLVTSVGLLGLLSSFSRSAWLAFTIGLLVWIVRAWISSRSAGRRLGLSRSNPPLQFIVPAILAVVFVLLCRELVVSRFVNLDTPIEARSLNDRRRDADLAVELIARHPCWGVGAGNYLTAVRSFELDSRPVHSVPLLVTAELGVAGAVLWLWLTAAGLHPRSRALGPWLAAVVIGLFDVNLWMTTSWRAAILFALLASRAALSVAGGPCAADWRQSASPEQVP